MCFTEIKFSTLIRSILKTKTGLQDMLAFKLRHGVAAAATKSIHLDLTLDPCHGHT